MAMIVAHGRRHVNDSFDQLGLFEMRHGRIATLKFGPRETVAIDERRYARGVFRRIVSDRGHIFYYTPATRVGTYPAPNPLVRPNSFAFVAHRPADGVGMK